MALAVATRRYDSPPTVPTVTHDSSAYPIYVERGAGRDPLVFLPHLRTWRHAVGWTQWELCAHSGISRGHIRALEHQRRPASFSTVGQLASALGIQNWVLTREAPGPDELVVPTVRVQPIEIPAGDGTTELRFYLSVLSYKRRSAGLSVEQLAERAGLDVATMRDIEQLVEPASLGLVARLAAALGIPQLELVKFL